MQDADHVLLRDRGLDDEDRPEDAEEDERQRGQPERAEHRPLAPAARRVRTSR